MNSSILDKNKFEKIKEIVKESLPIDEYQTKTEINQRLNPDLTGYVESIVHDPGTTIQDSPHNLSGRNKRDLYSGSVRIPLAASKQTIGTLDLGLHLYASSTTSLVGYTNADWACYPSTRSAEAEYRGVDNVVAETAWLCNLLGELHSLLSTAILVYRDNVRVLHVPSHFQYADIFTKGLPSALFEEFQFSLSVRPPHALTAGAY
ncbi:ribonuclease H-like domain-containing protein [Tanacetum coccineum]